MWYAVSTIPGAQLPKREYVTEQTSPGKDGRPRGKGYRIVPNINHDLSAIERALEANGFEFYMPTEKRLVRDRRHTDLYKIRRFALMVGYVFVRCTLEGDEFDAFWYRLSKTPGVKGIVRSSSGAPMPIDILDIMDIRAAEAEYDALFDIQSKNARAKLRKKAKTDPRLMKLVDKLDFAGKFTIPITSEMIAAE